jgi:hypothetical protein
METVEFVRVPYRDAEDLAHWDGFSILKEDIPVLIQKLEYLRISNVGHSMQIDREQLKAQRREDELAARLGL